MNFIYNIIILFIAFLLAAAPVYGIIEVHKSIVRDFLVFKEYEKNKEGK